MFFFLMVSPAKKTCNCPLKSLFVACGGYDDKKIRFGMVAVQVQKSSEELGIRLQKMHEKEEKEKRMYGQRWNLLVLWSVSAG